MSKRQCSLPFKEAADMNAQNLVERSAYTPALMMERTTGHNLECFRKTHSDMKHKYLPPPAPHVASVSTSKEFWQPLMCKHVNMNAINVHMYTRLKRHVYQRIDVHNHIFFACVHHSDIMYICMYSFICLYLYPPWELLFSVYIKPKRTLNMSCLLRFQGEYRYPLSLC